MISYPIDSTDSQLATDLYTDESIWDDDYMVGATSSFYLTKPPDDSTPLGIVKQIEQIFYQSFQKGNQLMTEQLNQLFGTTSVSNDNPSVSEPEWV